MMGGMRILVGIVGVVVLPRLEFLVSPEQVFMSPDWSAKVEPIPYSNLGNPQSLNLYSHTQNNPVSGLDADGHCSGDGDQCSNIKVTAAVTKQPTFQKNVTEKVDGKPTLMTGPKGEIRFQVTSKGTPLPRVKVAETNKDTLTVNGKQVNSGTPIEGHATSKDQGNFSDEVGRLVPTDGSTKQNDAIIKGFSSAAVSDTDKQTLTLTLPNGGGICTATDTRTLTNVGTDGKPSANYTITPANPQVTVTPPPPPPPPPVKPQGQ
jgi:hypothetical protein